MQILLRYSSVGSPALQISHLGKEQVFHTQSFQCGSRLGQLKY